MSKDTVDVTITLDSARTVEILCEYFRDKYGLVINPSTATFNGSNHIITLKTALPRVEIRHPKRV